MKELIFLFFGFITIYLISRQVINEFYFLLKKIFKKEKIVFLFLSLIFFPGTIIHELSHFFAAMILFLPVKDIKIFPEIEEKGVKLGSVYYIKKDFFRGFLVGIAPIFGAMASLWTVSHLPQNFIVYYFIFSVTSTMFSSKKDLEDLIYLIPMLLLISALVYLFNIEIDFLLQKVFTDNLLVSFLKRVNYYLVISIFINFFIFVILRLLRSIFYARSRY